MRRENAKDKAIPAGYTQLEYIQFPHNQHLVPIATGLIPDINYKINARLLFYNTTYYGSGASAPTVIGGGWTSSAATRLYYIACFDKRYNGGFQIYNTLYGIPSVQNKKIDYGQIYDIESYIADGLQYIKADNEVFANANVAYTNRPASWDNTQLYVGNEFGGDGTNGVRGFYGRVFSVTITNILTGELLLNWIPVKRDQDNKYGFYDTVQEIFRTSSENFTGA